ATEPNYDPTPKFLWQRPKIAVITNIELDHPDLYKSEDEVISAYRKFSDQLISNGILIVNGDDRQVQKLRAGYTGKVITYGFSSGNKYVIKKITISQNQTFFWIETGSTLLGEFCLNVVGEHNALNALASIVVSLECGLTLDSIRKGLTKFIGSKRRFEYIGKLSSGALLFDDYAHHPTEIRETLKAFRKAFPKYRVICIFQPHTYSRTKIMFEQFIHSFNDADEIIISNIYPSLREKPDLGISSKLLVDGINRFHKNANYLADTRDVVEYINKKGYQGNTIVLMMGAGDIYKVQKDLNLIEGN
ncbi:MAG: Mur ligase family protein, partial [Patescibacteria group bacterium]|nr:Mur ligase family protein [Patescibacteria group bacterium]